MSKGLCVVLVEDSYETVEFHYPRLRLEEAGYTVKAVGPQAKKVYQSKEGYWGTSDAVFSVLTPPPNTTINSIFTTWSILPIFHLELDRGGTAT
jgi:putative intracellular protease/amidase